MPADPIAASHEPHPDPHALTSSNETGQKEDYTPHPETSIPLPPERQKMLDSICALSSGKCQRSRHVYAEKAVYDDPPSFCALLNPQRLSISVRALVDIIEAVAGIKVRAAVW
jgi:hypothetical protein